MAMRYPYIKILPEWVTHAEQGATQDSDKQRRYSVLWTIVFYGVFGKEPHGLPKEEMEWFNKEVRPELDRQRKRIEEGRSL